MNEIPPPDPPEIVLADPDDPPYAEDGTDLTLIRSMLRKTPTERLATAQAHANAVLKIWRELGYR